MYNPRWREVYAKVSTEYFFSEGIVCGHLRNTESAFSEIRHIGFYVTILLSIAIVWCNYSRRCRTRKFCKRCKNRYGNGFFILFLSQCTKYGVRKESILCSGWYRCKLENEASSVPAVILVLCSSSSEHLMSANICGDVTAFICFSSLEIEFTWFTLSRDYASISLHIYRTFMTLTHSFSISTYDTLFQ